MANRAFIVSAYGVNSVDASLQHAVGGGGGTVNYAITHNNPNMPDTRKDLKLKHELFGENQADLYKGKAYVAPNVVIKDVVLAAPNYEAREKKEQIDLPSQKQKGKNIAKNNGASSDKKNEPESEKIAKAMTKALQLEKTRLVVAYEKLLEEFKAVKKMDVANSSGSAAVAGAGGEILDPVFLAMQKYSQTIFDCVVDKIIIGAIIGALQGVDFHMGKVLSILKDILTTCFNAFWKRIPEFLELLTSQERANLRKHVLSEVNDDKKEDLVKSLTEMINFSKKASLQGKTKTELMTEQEVTNQINLVIEARVSDKDQQIKAKHIFKKILDAKRAEEKDKVCRCEDLEKEVEELRKIFGGTETEVAETKVDGKAVRFFEVWTKMSKELADDLEWNFQTLQYVLETKPVKKSGK